MDTKLKNNKKKKYIAAFVLVAAVIIGNFLIFPFIEKEAAAYQESSRQQMIDNYYEYADSDDGIPTTLIRDSYILYMEQLQRETTDGTVVDATVFLKNNENYQDYTVDELKTCIEEWQDIFDSDREDLDYAVFTTNPQKVTESGNAIESSENDGNTTDGDYLILGEQNTTENLSAYLTDPTNESTIQQLQQTYSFMCVLSYDAYGNLSIDSVWDENGAEDSYMKALQSVGKLNLFAEYSSDLSDNLIGEPKNLKIVYGIKADSSLFMDYYTYQEGDLKSIYFWNTNLSEIFYISLLLLAIFVIVVTPDKKLLFKTKESHGKGTADSALNKDSKEQVKKEIAEEEIAEETIEKSTSRSWKDFFLFKRPFELSLILILIILFGMHAAYCNLSYYYMTDTGWENSVFSAYPVLLAMIMYIGLFVLFLAVIFVIWMISIRCICGILQVGPKQYFENSALGYGAWKWLVKKGKEFKEEVKHYDLSDKHNKTLKKLLILNFVIMFFICWMWGFAVFPLIIYSIILYYAIKKHLMNVKQDYEQLYDTTKAVANGQLDIKKTTDMGMFQPINQELQKVQDGFKLAVDEEVKSQRMKTDLITNVSHDLKTPLTAITTYVELLKNEDITDEERRQYIDVLDRKALRLKVLIEDLFDVSKATSETMKLDIVDLDIVNLIKQVGAELDEKFQEANLQIRYNIPDEKVILALDGNKTYRMIENLFVNVTKYALPNTRVYVDVEQTPEEVQIFVSNVSSSELNFKEDEITERFVRGDVSRNTEGSGLGLAIVKSFAEAMNGKLEIKVDGDLFKAILTWPAKKQ